MKKYSKGQSLVEYALILALVSVVCVSSLGNLSGGVNAAVGKVNGKLGASGGGIGIGDPAPMLDIPPVP